MQVSAARDRDKSKVYVFITDSINITKSDMSENVMEFGRVILIICN